MTCSPNVTVSLAYYGCAKTLRCAVESILKQTYSELTLVVVNDGDEPPWHLISDIRDKRLVCFDLPKNYGRYFADAIVLNATSDQYLLIQDADDWSDANRLSKLMLHLRAEHTAGALSSSWCHHSSHGKALRNIEKYKNLNRPLTPTFEHRANHHGLFLTSALRSIGGYYGGYRIGYDTLIINFLLMISRLTYIDKPLYHRLIHANSLTNSRDTGMQSSKRRLVIQHLQQMYTDAFEFYQYYLDGKLKRDDLCARIRHICKKQIAPETHNVLQKQSKRLRELLSNREGSTQDRHFSQIKSTGDYLVNDPRLPWLTWGLSKNFAKNMLRHLDEERPRCVLEIGSGSSTVLFAYYAMNQQAKVVSLEHDRSYFEKTKDLLRQFGLSEFVDLRLAPLTDYRCNDGKKYPWYDTHLCGAYDFVFIDGPPECYGRKAALFAIAPNLAERWVIWMHDGHRPHERKCVELWRKYFHFTHSLDLSDPKGVLQLSGQYSTMAKINTTDMSNATLGISLLTGGRLALLKRTIKTLRANYNEVLEKNKVIVMVNGRDHETYNYVKQLSFVDQTISQNGNVLPIGVATSLLVQKLVSQNDVEFILHLEDDWVADTTDLNWLQRAIKFLSNYQNVGQVRLRHISDKVLTYHMITCNPIHWERRNGFLFSPAAHYTFNPSLIRSKDFKRIFPCNTESEAQINFLRAELATIQLLPGAFRHIGDHQSRRERRERAIS